MTFKIVNPNNGNETKSNIFPWDIFKSDAISFFSKILKQVQTSEMKQNQTFFHGAYSNLTPYLFYQKILKHFNDFQSRNFSVV